MTASAWTADRVDRLKILWLQGKTADQIARDLANGISRSAVLGKVYRMGLSSGRAVPTVKSDVRPKAAPIRPAALMSASFADPVPPPQRGITTVLSVRRCECRWPFGEPGSDAFSLCGRRVARGVYCGPHGQIAYRPVRETAATLERLARLN